MIITSYTLIVDAHAHKITGQFGYLRCLRYWSLLYRYWCIIRVNRILVKHIVLSIVLNIRLTLTRMGGHHHSLLSHMGRWIDTLVERF